MRYEIELNDQQLEDLCTALFIAEADADEACEFFVDRPEKYDVAAGNRTRYQKLRACIRHQKEEQECRTSK